MIQNYSDPELVLTFLSFLRKICKIDEKRLRILIHYHSDQNEKVLIAYWSTLTKIAEKQFYKSAFHSESGKKSTKRLEFGTISLRYADSQLYKQILAKIEELKYINKPE